MNDEAVELLRDKVILAARALSNWLLARTGQPSESFNLRQAIKDYDSALAQPNAVPQPSTAEVRTAPVAAASSSEGVGQGEVASAAPDSGMPEEPKRFAVWCAATHGHDVIEHQAGPLVKASDYERLRANALREREDVERLRAALGLIWSIHVRKVVHLGLERFSGFEQDCIACVAALALGESNDGDGGLTADDYIRRRQAIKDGDAAPSAGGEGGEKP